MAGQGGDGFAQRRFGRAVLIDVGGIEEVDPEIEGSMDQSSCLGVVDAAAKREPGAKGDLADLQTAPPQGACSHGFNLARIIHEHPAANTQSTESPRHPPAACSTY